MKKNIVILSALFLTNCYKFKSNDFYCKEWGQVKKSKLKKRDLKILQSNPKDLQYPKDKHVIMMMTNSNIFNFDLSVFREYCDRNKYSVPYWLIKEKNTYEKLKTSLEVSKDKLPKLESKLEEVKKTLPDIKANAFEKLKKYEAIEDKHYSLLRELKNVRQKVKIIESKFSLESKICEVVYTSGSTYNTQSKTLSGFGIPLPSGNCMKKRIMLNGGIWIYIAGINEREIDYGRGPYRVFEMPHDIISSYYATPNYNGMYYIFYRNKEQMIKVLFGNKVYKDFKRSLSLLLKEEKRLISKIRPFSKVKYDLLNAKDSLDNVNKSITELESEIYAVKYEIKKVKRYISIIEKDKK